MNHKSAINWDYLAQAKRLQEKLQQYFGLVEQVRALEEDPELQAALGGLMGGAVPSAVPSAAHSRSPQLPPLPQASGRGVFC